MKKGSIGSFIFRTIIFFVSAGFFVAFMRAMDWDPFGAVGWIWDSIIDPIANKFSSNPTFQEVTRSP